MERKSKPQFLMIRPDHYRISYVINPWMEGNVNRTALGKAQNQWESLYKIVANFADVRLMDGHEGLPDMVFTANAGLVIENRVLLARFYHPERRAEEELFCEWFESNGFDVVKTPEGIFFEGAGDALLDCDGRWLWAGYGLRSSLESHPYIAKTFNIETLSLRLTDKRFYHLDTCFCPLPKGYLMYIPSAFDAPSNRLIEERTDPDKRIVLDEVEAPAFTANAVAIDNTIIMNCCFPSLREKLGDAGFNVLETCMSEFMKAGGSAKCLTIRLDEKAIKNRKALSTVTSRIIEVTGQLIDSGLMTEMLDIIVNGGGSFRIDELKPGYKKNEVSTAKIEVIAPRDEVLNRLIQKLVRQGATLSGTEKGNATLEVVKADGVAPEHFATTTIYPTDVMLNGEWLRVENQRMDGVIVLNNGSAKCTLIRDVKKGDMVVTGGLGIKVSTFSDKSDSGEKFSFMGSSVSSERKVEIAIDRVTWEMERIKERAGKLVVVAGPVVVHTGGVPALSWMVKNGYISALLGGNAIATHDVENAFYGTSLGVDLRSGQQVEGGHRNHLGAINTIRKAGSMEKAVERGWLNSGLFYELVKNKIPFSLAGSIRDDGPLPETKMDLIEAQAEYARLIKGAEMILMLSSMLHSIGVGNMAPAGVKLVCVDINPAVVTKLADRGSLESVGIVTDVGLFLALLVERLKKR